MSSRFLVRCETCGGEARRKYPADPKTLRVYQCRRRACIDCGRSIAYRGPAHESVKPPEGIPSIRDRCIPCGAAAGSPFAGEGDGETETERGKA